jgi:AcrR family transcriptional regulator
MRQRARKGEGERLRGEIIEAADRLLVETGDEDAVTVRAVAREVGCTAPAIYLHFEDRQELLLAVAERYFADLDRHVDAAVDRDGDPVECLRRGAAAYVQWGVDNPEPYRMIFMTRRDEVVSSIGATAFGHLVEAAQRAIDARRISQRDALLVATGLWSVMHGVASLAVAMPDALPSPLDTLTTHVMEKYLAGLTVDAATMEA